MSRPKPLRLAIRWKGRDLAVVNVTLDPDDDKAIREHLLQVMAEKRREGWRNLPDYTVDVFDARERYTPDRTVRFEAKR